MINTPISRAIELIGLQRMASELGVTYQAIRKWEAAERLPRTEWTGETQYAEKIEQLTNSAITKSELLEICGRQVT